VKTQWSLLLALVFALLIALFAVLNVEPVKVDYYFGTAHWPLILIVLGSLLAGVIITAAIGEARIYRLKKDLKKVRKERDELKVKTHLAAKDAAEPDVNANSFRTMERP
jgi:lipopolysaccharide assembly protein A